MFLNLTPILNSQNIDWPCSRHFHFPNLAKGDAGYKKMCAVGSIFMWEELRPFLPGRNPLKASLSARSTLETPLTLPTSSATLGRKEKKDIWTLK